MEFSLSYKGFRLSGDLGEKPLKPCVLWAYR